MAQKKVHGLRAWVALAVISMTAGSTSLMAASAVDEMQSISSTWDAQLSVALEGGKKNVQLGDPVRYHLSAAEGGHCYLLHVDAQGASSLMRPSDCNKASSGSYFPSSGQLTASAPEGKETVFAILVPEPLDSAEKLLGTSPGYASLDKADVKAILGDLEAASSAQQLALARTSYSVGNQQLAMADPELQFTTRGIIRKVVESTEPTDGNKEAMDEVSFDVQSINFEFGSAELAPLGVRQLNEFGAALVSPELESTKLRVAGHTDDQGEESYNLNLSERRAAAVAEYLIENFDVNDERLEIVGMGEEKPLVADTSLQARAKNRRVEMVFLAN